LASGVTSVGAGPPGDSTGELTRCSFTTVRSFLAALHFLTAAVTMQVVPDSEVDRHLGVHRQSGAVRGEWKVELDSAQQVGQLRTSDAVSALLKGSVEYVLERLAASSMGEPRAHFPPEDGRASVVAAEAEAATAGEEENSRFQGFRGLESGPRNLGARLSG
jgi:hypothetical protein